MILDIKKEIHGQMRKEVFLKYVILLFYLEKELTKFLGHLVL